jgi:hypothetical protein
LLILPACFHFHLNQATTVFSMDVPAAQAGFSLLDHGGQIFFRPNDPSLYLVTGHGVSTDFISSNKSSLLGKILRLHVDHDMPGKHRNFTSSHIQSISNSLPNKVGILDNLAKQEILVSNGLANEVGIFRKLASMASARAYLRARIACASRVARRCEPFPRRL